MTMHCAHCGKPIEEGTGKGWARKFCGSICRGRARNVRDSTGRPSGRPPKIDDPETVMLDRAARRRQHLDEVDR